MFYPSERQLRRLLVANLCDFFGLYPDEEYEMFRWRGDDKGKETVGKDLGPDERTLIHISSDFPQKEAKIPHLVVSVEPTMRPLGLGRFGATIGERKRVGRLVDIRVTYSGVTFDPESARHLADLLEKAHVSPGAAFIKRMGRFGLAGTYIWERVSDDFAAYRLGDRHLSIIQRATKFLATWTEDLDDYSIYRVIKDGEIYRYIAADNAYDRYAEKWSTITLKWERVGDEELEEVKQYYEEHGGDEEIIGSFQPMAYPGEYTRLLYNDELKELIRSRYYEGRVAAFDLYIDEWQALANKGSGCYKVYERRLTTTYYFRIYRLVVKDGQTLNDPPAQHFDAYPEMLEGLGLVMNFSDKYDTSHRYFED